MHSMIRMKKTLRDFTNLLLIVLCDYVLGEFDYLFLVQPSHIAFSGDAVFVEYNYQDDTADLKNISIELLDANTNQTITERLLPVNQSQGVVAFECSYFSAAGYYLFSMNLEDENGSHVHVRSDLLNVTWPSFYIDLNRTLNSAANSLLIGVFTNEYLCHRSATDSLLVSVQFKHRNSIYELSDAIPVETLPREMSKQIYMTQSQWVKFDCIPTNQEDFVIVSLKSLQTLTVITSTGPIDLVKRFGYKLVVGSELTCDSLADVHVVPPPCSHVHGKIVVYKETPTRTGESITPLVETIIYPGNNIMALNCTLFELGVNRYCFELFMVSTKSYSFPREKECATMRRDIEAWGMWQSWSSCSVTCGEGARERHRECLTVSAVKNGCHGAEKETSFCSLDDCSIMNPSSKPSPLPEKEVKTSNTVTVTGISLCLFIIIVTIVITVWSKLCRVKKCSASARQNAAHSPSLRKNSDEENICQPSQMRESFSDGCEAQPTQIGEVASLPLNQRQSLLLAHEPTLEQGHPSQDSSQTNTQKIIPPIFSYRLAQQQLKEMKKKGLTETTKIYHVCQNPLTDTVLDATLVTSPLVTESSNEATTNPFRINSPFLEPANLCTKFQGERPSRRLSLTSYHTKLALSPSQTLSRLSYSKDGQFDKSYRRNPNFRRTASFHETKQARPFRERSMTALSPRQATASGYRCRTWDQAVEERFRPKSRAAGTLSSEGLECSTGTRLTREALRYFTKLNSTTPTENYIDMFPDHRLSGRDARSERYELSRNRRNTSPNYRSSWRKEEESNFTVSDSCQRSSTVDHSQHTREKCENFPPDPACSYYDNTSFRLTEAEQRMIDLPGYFGSNEEDETSSLSTEKLVT